MPKLQPISLDQLRTDMQAVTASHNNLERVFEAVPRLLGRLQAVHALHRSVAKTIWSAYHLEHGAEEDHACLEPCLEEQVRCITDGDPWPCKTAVAAGLEHGMGWRS